MRVTGPFVVKPTVPVCSLVSGPEGPLIDFFDLFVDGMRFDPLPSAVEASPA
jgi:hypothetical protein